MCEKCQEIRCKVISAIAGGTDTHNDVVCAGGCTFYVNGWRQEFDLTTLKGFFKAIPAAWRLRRSGKA